jgi:hypothetical protein
VLQNSDTEFTDLTKSRLADCRKLQNTGKNIHPIGHGKIPIGIRPENPRDWENVAKFRVHNLKP